jgi:hypothetical protein
VKPVIEFSIKQLECLLKRASEASPVYLYLRLRNAVKIDANTVVVLCNVDEASMLLEVAKHFCPDAVSQIEEAIRVARLAG